MHYGICRSNPEDTLRSSQPVPAWPPQRLYAVEVSRKGRDQIGIELMLRNDLAKAIARCAADTIAVKALRRQLS